MISPVGELGWKDKKMVINNGEIGELSQRIYDTITGIQAGKLADEFGWVTMIEYILLSRWMYWTFIISWPEAI